MLKYCQPIQYLRLNSQHCVCGGGEGAGGDSHLSSENLIHVDNEQNIHMNSKNYKENCYDIDLDLLISLY